MRVAWVGDCRVYRLGHTGVLEQVTIDHTGGEHRRQLGIIDRDAPPCPADSIDIVLDLAQQHTGRRW